MAIITIISNKHGTHNVLVDDEDFEELSKYKWNFYKNKNILYVKRHIKINGVSTSLKMHRSIMGLKNNDKLIVDHINHNSLDNRKINLRVCKQSDNCKNKTSHKNSSSKYLGVYFNKNSNKWQSQICTNKKIIYLGIYLIEEDAAKAYNEAALKYHGEFANLNNF